MRGPTVVDQRLSGPSQYKDAVLPVWNSHYKTRPSYFHNGIPSHGKDGLYIEAGLCFHCWCNGPLIRYVKLRVAHAPGMFSPPPRVSDSDMHHGTCMTHVSWCMLGSPFPLKSVTGESVRGIPGACATRNFTYLVRSPYIWNTGTPGSLLIHSCVIHSGIYPVFMDL